MIKRVSDCLFALVGLLVAAPLLALLAVIIACDLGRPVLFRQQRPGKDGKPFELLKFRTMRAAFDAEGQALPDCARLTRLGRALRSTSLDELPSLYNVVRGHMSLVGPRPLLMEYLPLYDERQKRRHDVRPGLTGWAQVNGRNALSWDAKFAYDVWYVEHQSLALDLCILMLTAMKVLRREGISAADDATMPKFTGASRDGRDVSGIR